MHKRSRTGGNSTSNPIANKITKQKKKKKTG